MNLKKVATSNIDVIGDTSYRGDCPSETAEMIGFFSWLRSHHPKLAAVAVHVRNEGQRSKRQGYQHKQEGMNTGASDIVIPVNPPICIEMKRSDHTKSTISDEQLAYLVAAQDAGAYAVVALGCKGAMEVIAGWIEHTGWQPR